jgi:hypothetical protein
MKGWAGLDEAADALTTTPLRWASARLHPYDGEPKNPSPADVETGFAVVERGLSALGPADDDEPTWTEYADQDLMDWTRFVERFEDRRTINARAVREFLATLTTPPTYPRARKVVSWRGLMRGWLRAQLGEFAQSIIMEVPAHYREDPNDLREVAFRCFERVALLLPDGDQTGCLVMVSDQVQMRVADLARRLYHHPEAGPKMKKVLDEIFVEAFAAKLKADPPEHHEPIPWR